MSESNKTCVLCQKTDAETPLLQLSYNSITYWVCPSHMPLLIHKPDQLIGMLPGAENMEAG
jgi:hypothetical protein